MPLDPVPVNRVPLCLLVQQLPEVGIFNRFPGSCFPPIRFPVIYPLINPLQYVPGVSFQVDITGTGKRPEAFNRCGKLHAIVGSLRLITIQCSLLARIAQDNPPTPGTGITPAGAIGINYHPICHISYRGPLLAGQFCPVIIFSLPTDDE